MKSKEELMSMLYCILTEIQSGSLREKKREIQKTKLELLYEILGEEVPVEYWEQIEEEIYR